MDLRETYNRIAEDWHADHHNDNWWVTGADAFVSLLHPGDAILDIGCGGGIKTAYLIDKGFKVVGIDLSENMINIAKREVPGGTFIACDLAHVDTLGRQFDAIFAQAVLLHIPKKEIVDRLRSMVGQLKHGGHLYVSVKQQRPGEPEEATIAEHDYGYPYERFFSYFTADELRMYFGLAGLAVVSERIVSVGATRWVDMIGKKIG